MHNIKSDFIDLSREQGIKCIFDCGSRDALDGMELAGKLDAAELHVFECNPPAVELCRRNLACWKNPVKTYLNPFAVCEKEGELEFYSINPHETVTDWNDGNIGASSLYKANPRYPYEKYVQNKIRVRSLSLDTYCRDHSIPDLLWMDLQGAEKRALQGAAHILPMVKVIHIEAVFRPIFLEQPLYWDLHRILKKQFRLARLYDVKSRLLLRLNTFLDREKWFTNAVYVNKNLL